MKVLLFENDCNLAEKIKHYFDVKNYLITTFSRTDKLLNQVNFLNYDILIIDISLPNNYGFELLEFARNKCLHTPIIILSPFSEIIYKRKAFHSGCNDYITKPFNIEELELRVDNLVKIFNNNEKIDLGNSVIYDKEYGEIKVNDEVIELSKKQRDIVHILAENSGRVMTHDDLIDTIYNMHTIQHKTIASHIRDIHKKIGKKIIQNIRGVGYKINLIK